MTAADDPAVFNDRPADPSGPRAIRLQRLVRGPIERVSTFLVESDHRRRWLAEGQMDLRVGGAMDLTWRNAELTEHPGPVPPEYANDPPTRSMNGTITACQPPRLLAFTWTIGGTATEVTFELTPHDDRVLLVLTHRALGSVDALVSVSTGWHTHVGLLVDLLDGIKPDGFWTRFSAVRPLYRKRLQGAEGLATPRPDV